MAHYAELKNGIDVSKVKVSQTCRNDEFPVKTDLYVELRGFDRLRCLFEQVLFYFNKDIIGAFPPKLCDGVDADLFTLFWVVRKIGDYESVSKNELWEFVAKECGLDIIHVGALKLIYFKYLKELDQWLTRGGFKDTKLENGEHSVVAKLESLFHELRGCNYSLSSVRFKTDKKAKCIVIESSDDGNSAPKFKENLDVNMAKYEMGLSRINNVDEDNEETAGLDLNLTRTEAMFPIVNNVNVKNEEFGGLNLDMANAKTRFLRINNVDEKVENFGGVDERRLELCPMNDDDKRDVLCMMNVHGFHSNNNDIKDISNTDDNTVIFAKTIVNNVVGSQKRIKEESLSKKEVGFSRIYNVDENNEEIGGLDLNLSQYEMVFPRINNVNMKDEEVNGLDLDIVEAKMGFSRINNVDEKDEEFGLLDERRLELSNEVVVKKVDVSRIKDDGERDVLYPMNVLGLHPEHNDHNDNNDDNTMIFAKTIVNNVVGSRKRRKKESCSSLKMKKEESLSFSKMLEWVANAARNPHDDNIRSIPNSSKWKKYKGNEIWKQVLLVKETLSVKRNVDSGNKFYGSQKKRHMMHPSMYEDDKIPIHLSSKRIRCSQRVSLVKSCSCPGCTSCSSSRNKRVKKSLQILEPIEVQDDMCEDLETESVTVGAEVPEWTGVVSESDPKWLGTRMWPPPEGNIGKREKDLVVIGEGRQSSCTCPIPGSADCVRFHISENRTKVKDTLGPLFYKWKFDHMGEEASVSLWSLEEETEFKSLVSKARLELADRSKSRHEIMSNFWRRASDSIPSKTKDMLVSYYYNVFVLRRRSYQNRIMPENIDSDDDEHEVGHEKIHALSIIDLNLES